MPVVDMPLEQLKVYAGTNPRPKDFDQYWESSIAEMHALDPQLQLVPSTFQAPHAECFDLYFTGVRGARIHAKYVRPKHVAGKHPAVLMFHGYSGHAGDWSEKLAYASLGFSVLAMDCRGQGGSSEDVGGVKGNTHTGHIIRGLDGPADNLLFRHIFLDTAQLARIAMGLPEVDAEQVYVTGGSQGGGLTIACAALEPGVKKVAPIFPFLSDYKRIWDMDLDKDAYGELRTYFRYYDMLHEREDEVFEKLGYIDIQFLAERVKGETMMIVGLMDTVCPPSTQFAVYNKMMVKKRLVIYPDFGHEYLPESSDRVMQFFLE